jgi:hypothetical protein
MLTRLVWPPRARPALRFSRASCALIAALGSIHIRLSAARERRRKWKHARPGLGALAVAVFDRQQLLAPVLTDADHDQQTHLRVLTQAHLDVDPSMNR